jgi:hypothetical protein
MEFPMYTVLKAFVALISAIIELLEAFNGH